VVARDPCIGLVLLFAVMRLAVRGMRSRSTQCVHPAAVNACLHDSEFASIASLRKTLRISMLTN